MAKDVIRVTYFVRHAVLTGRERTLIDYAEEQDCVERSVELDVDLLSGGANVSLLALADDIEDAIKNVAGDDKPCCGY